ncbi:sulfite exporter TauE/SafE family protein [Vitreoscilla massiliensis]|uniref:Probable membrane transporter protein n=1 Tax=Vitreoscilla massiliensis TaxID=1689272 RepID=A0ABY4DZ59_9NEIS|nr:sulfite exporter TauE/SafE family protein [Vitreoscilla massiliensis]UOO88592.1 sulfite exporter TauE/SafE family protein [Vitreoscilla massiliensis]
MYPLAASTLFIIASSVLLAYTLFGISGFGTALIAAPLLSLYLPLPKIVPLLALLDVLAACNNVYHDRKFAQRSALKTLLPTLLLGACIGATLLLQAQLHTLMLGMGVLLVVYAIYGWCKRPPSARMAQALALPLGLTGGVLGAVFGSGGFLYAIYLSATVPDKQAIRATLSTLIACSTLFRVVLYMTMGTYADTQLLLLCLCLLPCMLLGTYLGRRLSHTLPPAQFQQTIHGLLLLTGIHILYRYWN